MSNSITVEDLATYLNNPAILTDPRAQFIIDKAATLCQTIVNPLPDGADVVLLDVAERAYANPSAVSRQNPGLYAEGEGPFNDETPGYTGGGLWLTRGNIATLRQLSGGGSGAFSVDMTPAGAAANLPWWDTGEVWFQP